MKQTLSRLVKLEQLAAEKETAGILIVADRSEVPTTVDPRALVICTGVSRSKGSVVR